MEKEIEYIWGEYIKLHKEEESINMGNMYFSSYDPSFYFAPDGTFLSRLWYKIKYRKEIKRCLVIQKQQDGIMERIRFLRRQIANNNNLSKDNFNDQSDETKEFIGGLLGN